MATSAVPPIDGFLESAVYVESIERSVQFYSNLLGFEVIETDSRLHALRVGPRQVLLVCKRGASLQLPTGAHDGSGPQHLAFAIPAAAVEEWAARLAALKVPVEERRTWPRGGVSLYFRDPDGNLLELATPGVWTIY